MKIQLLATTLFTLILSACGGSSSSPSTQTGVFLDDAVEGLRYETTTQNGMTDANGTFKYQSGETIRFYVGDILIGEASASDVMTPVNLVPNAVDETNPTVTNIARFLQTLDEDGNPSNGIRISSSAFANAAGQSLDFNVDEATFTTNAQALINILMPASPPTLVSSVDAQTTLQATLIDILSNGSGGGTGNGAGSGSNTGILNLAGPDTSALGTSLNILDAMASDNGVDLGVSLQLDNGSVIAYISGATLSSIYMTYLDSASSSTYNYVLSCADTPTECNNVSIDESTKTISFNSVTLSPIPGSAGTADISLTLSTLNWR